MKKLPLKQEYRFLAHKTENWTIGIVAVTGQYRIYYDYQNKKRYFHPCEYATLDKARDNLLWLKSYHNIPTVHTDSLWYQ